MAVLGTAALLTAEVNAGIEVFKLLEPEIQKGLIGLFHLFHRKQTQLATVQAGATSADPRAEDQASEPVPKPANDLSSTSLSSETPWTS